jgi:hypothetical protein
MCLLIFVTIKSGRKIPTFGKNQLPVSSGWKNNFGAEEGGRNFFGNIGNFL